jgi:hypothetical protein
VTARTGAKPSASPQAHEQMPVSRITASPTSALGSISDSRRLAALRRPPISETSRAIGMAFCTDGMATYARSFSMKELLALDDVTRNLGWRGVSAQHSDVGGGKHHAFLPEVPGWRHFRAGNPEQYDLSEFFIASGARNWCRRRVWLA